MNRDIYQTITDRFIDQLKKRNRALADALARRAEHRFAQAVSRHQFTSARLRGVPISVLAHLQANRRSWRPRQERGEVHAGHLLQVPRKDGRPLEIRYVRDDGTPKRIPFVRWSNVFNLDQTEGIEPPAITRSQNDLSANDRAAAIVQKAKLCPIYHTGFAALYSPRDDVIRIPAPSTFYSPEDYYHTLFHEMTHATGHGSRLDREGVTNPVKFGSERYSKEELIAELGAAFLSNEAGILRWRAVRELSSVSQFVD